MGPRHSTACFEEALARSRSEPAAFALLELLVEQLGLDREALDVALPERALSGRVARLVALAAARTGDARRARSLFGRLDGPAEAEVRVLLPEGAVRAGDVATARSHLDAVRAVDPANGALLRIEDAIHALEGDARAPLEAEFAAALETRDETEIRTAAEALLEHDPRSGAARSALGTSSSAIGLPAPLATCRPPRRWPPPGGSTSRSPSSSARERSVPTWTSDGRPCETSSSARATTPPSRGP